MIQSKFKFFASTSPGLETALLRDLKALDINCHLTTAFGKKVVEFRSDLFKICEVLLRVRTMGDVKMMVGRPLHCANVKGLKRLLNDRMNLRAFWDIHDEACRGFVFFYSLRGQIPVLSLIFWLIFVYLLLLFSFRTSSKYLLFCFRINRDSNRPGIPQLKVHSGDSELFHTKMIKEVISSELFPLSREESLKQIGGLDSLLEEFSTFEIPSLDADQDFVSEQLQMIKQKESGLSRKKSSK